MNFEQRRVELLKQMKELEREERKAKASELKAERRKKNDFCKKEFGMSYSAIKEHLNVENNNQLSDEERFAIQFWNDIVTRYAPTDKSDLIRHLLSDRQVQFYNNRY